MTSSTAQLARRIRTQLRSAAGWRFGGDIDETNFRAFAKQLTPAVLNTHSCVEFVAIAATHVAERQEMEDMGNYRSEQVWAERFCLVEVADRMAACADCHFC